MKDQHAVVIAGGGPTGLMLAAELALAGVDVADRRAALEPGARRITCRRPARAYARGARSARHRRPFPRRRDGGIQIVGFHMIRLDISDFPSRHNYSAWTDPKPHRAHPRRLGRRTGRDVHRGRRGHRIHAGRRRRRHRAWPMAGACAPIIWSGAMADAAWSARPRASIFRARIRRPAGSSPRSRRPQEPDVGFPSRRRTATLMRPPRRTMAGPGSSLNEPRLRTDREPTLGDVREALLAAYGTDYGMHSPTWISRFTDMTRQAATYREGGCSWPGTPRTSITRSAARA